MDAPARVRPSSMGRIMQCPASLNAAIGYPNKDSPAAMEGTLAHAEFEQCMVFGTNAIEYDIQSALDYVEIAAINGAKVSTEIKLIPSQLGRDDTFGTADIIIEYFGGELIEVVDLKYGKGNIVEPEMNWQLIVYGLGAIVNKPNVKKVKLTIAQPRIDHPNGTVRSVVYTIDEINDFAEQIRYKLKLADAEEPVFGPSLSACRWCAAKGDCKPRADFNLNAMGRHFDKIEPETLPDVNKLTMDQSVEILDAAEMIKAWISDIEEIATDRLKAGKRVPGYKLVAGRSMRKWVEDEATTMAELKAIGLRLKDYTVSKLISPAAMDKIAKKEKLTASKLDKIKQLVEKPRGKATMAHETDRRPSVSIELPDKPFGPVVH